MSYSSKFTAVYLCHQLFVTVGFNSYCKKTSGANFKL